MKQKVLLTLSFLIASCGVREAKQDAAPVIVYRHEPAPDKLDNTITWLNDPKSLPGGDDSTPLVTDISMNRQGATLKLAWKSNWYPASEGGTVKVIEKYDLAIGDTEKKASTWEKQKTDALVNVKWAGHCNGWAAASVLTDEPKRDVVYNNVLFTVDDIKALLIESYQSSFGKTVGKRCNNTDIKYDNYGRMIDEDCRDVSPAAFHILLTNFLGRFQKPIIVDVEANHEVWNSPIVSYDIKIMQNLSVTEVTTWLTGQPSRTYTWNPNAILWTYFQTQVVFSDGNKKIYEYILERNNNGNIIGGEWFRESKSNHPDFIWRPSEANAENPYLSLKTIQEIHSRSL
jgi:hypothetical protein